MAFRGAGGRHGFAWRAAGAAAVAALSISGAGLIVTAVNAEPDRPPQPVAEASLAPTADPVTTPTAMATSAVTTEPTNPDMLEEPPALARAEPTGITIGKIGVHAEVMRLGLNRDGSLQVPPLERAELAGWYQLGPTPGEIGNSVIVGHVDSAKTGPAVFFKLGLLQPGDLIEVSRQDGSVARFTVDRVASYPKAEFPSELVYGHADQAQLRLVTCGGQFDDKRRSYLNNVIVFATFVP